MTHGVRFDHGLHTGFFELLQDCGQVLGITSLDVEIATRESTRDDEGSGLDAVGNNTMFGAAKFGHAFDLDGGGTCSFNFRSHGIEKRSEIGDLGLASAILHDGLAFGEGSCHEEIFGAGDSDLVEDDLGAAEPPCRRFDIAMFLDDIGAETFQPLDVKIDWTCANSAAAGQRHASASATRD